MSGKDTRVERNNEFSTTGGDASVPTVSTARDVFQKAINELGDLNMTAVVKLFEKNN